MRYPYVETSTGKGETLREVQAAARSMNVSLSNNPSDADLTVVGRAKVRPTTPPTGDIVLETSPTLGEDGLWYQAWEARNFAEVELVQKLEEVRVQKLEENNNLYDSTTNQLTANYPQAEKDTWPIQNIEAKAWAVDNNVATPWIDRAATKRGVDRVDYLNRTITKIALFEGYSADLTGIRQGYEDQIKAATSLSELEAIILDYTI